MLGATTKPQWGASRPAEALVRKSGITQVFQMPYDQQRKSESFNLAELCKHLGRETGTSIDASRSGQTQALTFVIKGGEEEIQTARRKLWSRLAESVVIELEVPEACLGLIIGPSGRKIAALMGETLTKITVPKSYGGSVVITGDFEGISLAKQKIETLIHDKINKTFTKMTIERHFLPFLFECKLSERILPVIAEYAEKNSVKIGVSGLRDEESVTLAFSGDKKDVAEANKQLEERLEIVRQTIKSVSTQINKNLHRFVVGPKASVLHDLEEETGCHIVVPPSESSSTSITVYGRDDALLKGLQAILEKTSAVDSQTVEVDAKLKALLLHRSRSFLRDLESKYSVNIHQNEAGFVFDGKKAEVTISMMELKKELDALKSFKFDVISVDSTYMKHVIGKKGQNLQQIESEFGVEVVISERDNDRILIAGKTVETITAAKERITKTVANFADLRVAEVKVDSKFHGKLIGPKGSNIKKIYEKYPSVLIRFEEGLVRLQGPSGELAEAQDEIVKEAEALKHDAIMHSYSGEVALTLEMLKAVTDAEGNITNSLANFARDHNIRNLELSKQKLTFQGLKKDVESFNPAVLAYLKKIIDSGSETIQVDHAFHSALIGKKGKNAKHFVQKYDIKLTFPKVDAENKDTIIVSGPRSNISAAIEEINEFIEYERTHHDRDTITVPDEAVPAILGRAGVTISNLRLETDTRIDLEKESDADGNRVFTLEGSLSGIEMAKKQIAELVKDRRVAEICTLGSEKFMLLMGIGSGAYRALIADYEPTGIIISADRNKEEIVIKGKRDEIPAVIEELKKLTLQKYVKESLEIPLRFHGEIIGNKGENIKKLSRTLRVAITIPKSQDTNVDPNLVIVEGTRENVDAAKEALLKYVRESEIVQIPREDRKELISKLSAEFEKLHVKVLEKPDGLIVLGEDVSKIQAAVAKIRTSHSELESSTEFMTVPRSFHGAIIGRAGLTIEALRKETGCSITVPKAGASSADQVKLRGDSSSIAKARQAITQIMDRQQ